MNISFEFEEGPFKDKIIKIWKWTYYAVIGFCIYLIAVFFNVFWLFGGMPNLKQIQNPNKELASIIISEDGQTLGKYFEENREPTIIKELSPHIIHAVIATEDVRFEQHSGVDLRGILRSLSGIVTFSNEGGGSTITQQVVKNLYEARGRQYRGLLGYIPFVKLVIIKTKEWITAIRLERNYTKEEILMLYLNTVSFGSNSFGIKSAAKTFFNKETSKLTLEEAAVLVGVLQNPDKWNPFYHIENSKKRRDIVLGQMLKYNFITKRDFSLAQKTPIRLKYHVESHVSGLAPYFREALKEPLKAWLKEYNSARPEEAQLDLYTSGLRIYTTVNYKMQTYAEEAVEEHMKNQQKLFSQHWKGRNPWVDENGREIKDFIATVSKRTERYIQLQKIHGEDEAAIMKGMKTKIPMRVFSWNGPIDTLLSPLDSIKYYKHFLNAGFMAMDPLTGKIKAWVGGINYRFFKYDHVKQGKRQPGSTFKPFVYGRAIETGFSPCDNVTDQPITFSKDDGISGTWTPENAGGGYSGATMSLRQGMGRSINSIAAYLTKNIGANSVMEFAKRCGISSPLSATPSICLGVYDVSIYEMVAAYSVFVNQGRWTEPLLITRIEDKNGNILHEFYNKTHEATSSDVAYKMLYMLKGAVQESGGTAGGLRAYSFASSNDIGAKTGTTNNYSDGWFMGVSSTIVGGVWVGGDDRSIHFRSIDLGQGGKMALPIWGKFMEKIYTDDELNMTKSTFVRPADFQSECGSYEKSTVIVDTTQTTPIEKPKVKKSKDIME